MYCWKWICVAWMHRLVTHLCNNGMQATLVATVWVLYNILFCRAVWYHLDGVAYASSKCVALLYLVFMNWLLWCCSCAMLLFWKRKLYQGSSRPAQGCVDHDWVVVQCRDWRVTMELLNKLSVFPNFRCRDYCGSCIPSAFPSGACLELWCEACRSYARLQVVQCLLPSVMWSMHG